MDPTERARPEGSGGLGRTLRSAVAAGLVTGLVFGLVDGVVAASAGPSLGLPQLLGCLAGAVFVYGLVWCVALVLAAPCAQLVLRRRVIFDVHVLRERIGVEAVAQLGDGRLEPAAHKRGQKGRGDRRQRTVRVCRRHGYPLLLSGADHATARP